MLKDIVIDTNVFMHAGNDAEPLQRCASEFIEALVNCNTCIGIDSGFSDIESQNRSFIWAEYLNNIQEGSAGRLALAHLLANERVSTFTRNVAVQIGRSINQMVADKSDRVFLKVTLNTSNKILVSHDYKAFTSSLRNQRRRLHGCCIEDAASAAKQL